MGVHSKTDDLDQVNTLDIPSSTAENSSTASSISGSDSPDLLTSMTVETSTLKTDQAALIEGKLSELAKEKELGIAKHREEMKMKEEQLEQYKAMLLTQSPPQANGHTSKPDASVLQQEVDKLKATIADLKAKEKVSMDRLAELQENKATMEAQREEQEKELEENIEKLNKAALVAEQEFLKIIERSGQEEGALANTVQTLTAALEKQRAENDQVWKKAQLEAGLTPIESQVTELSAQVEMLKTQHETNANQLAESKDNLHSLQLELEEEQATINGLVEKSEEELRSLKTEGETAQKQANDITTETNQKIDESTQVKVQIQQLEQTKNTLAQQKAELLAKKQKEDDRMKELKEKNTELNREKLRMEGEIRKIENSLADTRDEENGKAAVVAKRREALEKELVAKQEQVKKDEIVYETQFAEQIKLAQQKMQSEQTEELNDQKRLLEEVKSENEQLRLRMKALEKNIQNEKKTKAAKAKTMNSPR
ncbi:unnamed protein product [Amoebophrya sp. A120]|nr:unnamed protein product [Amoebophrya sp. A120]|eukprot:GSA120T00006871001.1